MTFQPDKIEAFKSIYALSNDQIRNFEGCEHVELLQADQEKNIFFTYSIWQSEAHLDAYRHSPVFEKIWGATKVLFGGKPEAWTVNEIKP